MITLHFHGAFGAIFTTTHGARSAAWLTVETLAKIASFQTLKVDRAARATCEGCCLISYTFHCLALCIYMILSIWSKNGLREFCRLVTDWLRMKIGIRNSRMISLFDLGALKQQTKGAIWKLGENKLFTWSLIICMNLENILKICIALTIDSFHVGLSTDSLIDFSISNVNFRLKARTFAIHFRKGAFRHL